MWQQTYTPIAHSLAWSSLVAALPVAALLYAIGIRRVSAWKSSLLGLIAAALVALFAYRMPPLLVVDSALYGAAFGTFPIFWVIYWAILLYRLTVDTGKFEILKNSIGHLTTDRSLQALLIAFAFGAFLEGAAGFGTPVAVAASILGGLGFPAFYAAGICLLANTAPVAFGSIAIPLVTLAATTGIPIEVLSKYVGRLCAPVSLFIPAYLVLVMGGVRSLRRVWPAALVCGVSFAGMQFVISNFVAPYLTDILSSLAAIVALVFLLRFWSPGRCNQDKTAISIRGGRVGLVAIFIARWSDSVVELEKCGRGPESREYHHRLAGSAQCCATDSTGSEQGCSVCGDLPVPVPSGSGNSVRGCYFRFGTVIARDAAPVGVAGNGIGETVEIFIRQHHGRACSCVRDELLGSDRHAGTRICGDGAGISILQRDAGMAGRVSDGQRYVGKCAIWEFAEGHGHSSGIEPCFNGVRKFGRRGDGEDDQLAEYFRGGGRGGIKGGGRTAAVPFHAETQFIFGKRGGAVGDGVRVCGLAADRIHGSLGGDE